MIEPRYMPRLYSPVSTGEFWRSVASGYDDHYQAPYSHYEDALVHQHMRHHWPSGSMLDIGCGTGLGAYLKHDSLTYQGCDASPEMVALASARFPDLDFQVACADRLPYADQSYDYVLMLYSLYYIDDLPRAVRELRRVLKPGGHYLVITLNRQGWWRWPDTRRRAPYGLNGDGGLTTEVTFLSRRDLLSLFAPLGTVNIKGMSFFGNMAGLQWLRGDGPFAGSPFSKNWMVWGESL